MEDTAKKRIVWITADHFLDVDMGIVPRLQSHFDIYWFVIMGKNTDRELPSTANPYEVIQLEHRNRNIAICGTFYKLIRKIKKIDPSVIYLDYMGIPYFPYMAFNLLDINKIIYLAHNIAPRPAWNKNDRLFIPKILKRVRYVHAISYQYNDYMKEHYPHIRFFNIPMSTKSFGNPNESITNTGKRKFLFFGHVAVNKRLDKLIEAFKALPKEDREKSELIVYGKCPNPQKYEEMIMNEEGIRLIFGFVSDKDIANIFSNASFLVLPYDDVSQSGPSMIAYNYYLPLIATDLEGFKEIVKDKENGFLYKCNDVGSLRDTLHECINLSEEEYENVKKSLKETVDSNFTIDALILKYCGMFKSVIDAERDN